jgi:hypothetical protein
MTSHATISLDRNAAVPGLRPGPGPGTHVLAGRWRGCGVKRGA